MISVDFESRLRNEVERLQGKEHEESGVNDHGKGKEGAFVYAETVTVRRSCHLERSFPFTKSI
jgi:hypothetical protein